MQPVRTMMAAVALLAVAGCAREDGSKAPQDQTGTNMATGVPNASAPDPAPAELAAGNAAAQQTAEGARAFFPGTWTGPEGLSFVVEQAPDGDGYRIRNRDTLDTEQTFDATRKGATLRFVRRGIAMTARPGTGAETGYKWLANKRDCLIVQAGTEGYCRD